jgi:hypothetical protein
MGVRRDGDLRGQEDRSSSAHARCCRRQAWNRLGDTRRNRKTARNGRNSLALSTARRIRVLARPSGRRSPARRNPEVRSRASASRSSAESFWTRRRRFRTSCRNSGSVRSAHSDRPRPSVPRPASHAPSSEGLRGCGDGHVAGALDEMPKAVVIALLPAGRGRHETIIGFLLTPLNSRGRWGASEPA